MTQPSKPDKADEKPKEAEKPYDLTRGFFERYYRRRRFGESTDRSKWQVDWSGEGR